MFTLIFNNVPVLRNVSEAEAKAKGAAMYKERGRGSWGVTESKYII